MLPFRFRITNSPYAVSFLHSKGLLRSANGVRCGSFGWRKEHEQAQIRGDGMEAVRDTFGDKDQIARPQGAVFVADTDLGVAAKHIIDLVFGVRLLRVG